MKLSEKFMKRASELKRDAESCHANGLTEAWHGLEGEAAAWEQAAKEIEETMISAIVEVSDSGAPSVRAASDDIDMIVVVPEFWEFDEVWTPDDVQSTIDDVEKTGLAESEDHNADSLLESLRDRKAELEQD